MRIAEPSARRRAGVTQVIVLASLLVLVGFVALAVDNGYMLATRTQLQHAADAAALAAMGEIQAGSSEAASATTAQGVAAAHRAGGAAVQLDLSSTDVVFGGFDFLTRQFVPGTFAGISAVQVTARRTAGSPAGPLALLLAPILGRNTAEVATSSVAAIGQRDVALVQDVTYSFQGEIEEARDALETFATALSSQSLSGDRIGLVTFNEAAQVEAPLSPVPDELGNVLLAIDQFTSCTDVPGGPAGWELPNCGGTHIAPGIREGIELFAQASPSTAERVILLVSDGVPCLPYDEVESERRRDEALAAVQEAEDADISIFSVFLDNPSIGLHGAVYCLGLSNNEANPDFMEELTSGFGQFYSTPNADQLDDILISILREMPLRLVD